MALENVMRVDNGNVIGSGVDHGNSGYIKKTGSTISELITALNGMTDDQKDRCVIAVRCQGYNSIFRLRCSTKAQSTGAFTFKWINVTSATYTQQVVLNMYDSTIKLIDDKNSAVTDLTITSWSILYQDDSTSGGNTYPASHVIMSDGETSVEDAIGLKIKYFDVSVPVGSTNYNFSSNKPSDLKAILSAMSISGGGAVIKQTGSSVMYFNEALPNASTIRIMYVAY